MIAVWLLLIGCDREPTEPPPVDAGDDDDTTDTDVAPIGTMSATCTPTDNVLRYACVVEVDPPAPVAISFEKSAGDGPVRTFTSDVAANEHTIVLYLMAPESSYTWTAASPELPGIEASGTFRTGTAPQAVDVGFTVDGTATFPYALAASPCASGAYIVIVGTEGELLWYHGFADGFASFLDGVQWTEDGTALAIVAGSLIEVDLLGNERLRLDYTLDYDEMVHHDAFRRDGLTYALHKDLAFEDTTPLVLDGFYVFDEAGALLADWRLVDHFQPPPPEPGPGGIADDYSHANSIWVDDDRNVYVSFRHLSAVAVVDGDLESPTFGAITWRLSGDPEDTDFGSDFTLVAAPGAGVPSFVQQHNAHVLPDGTFTMFDNRGDFFEPSRLLHLTVDPLAGTAVIEEAYDLDEHCDFQGGAWHTVGGNPVATCAPFGKAYEFDRGVTAAPRWTMDLECAGRPGIYVPRFVPLEESDL